MSRSSEYDFSRRVAFALHPTVRLSAGYPIFIPSVYKIILMYKRRAAERYVLIEEKPVIGVF
jgi:hypothetical protein